MAERWSYKGKAIAVEYRDDDHAEVTIEDRKFELSRHGEPLRLWSCDEVFFMSDDLHEVVRHLVDYWYIITDPNTAPFEGPRHGDLPERPGGVVPAHGHEGHVLGEDGERGEGGPRRTGGGQRRR